MKYYLYKYLFKLLSLSPWWLLKALSKGLSWLAYRLIGYRRRVVEENIKLSFPELSEIEQHKIVLGFYQHLVLSFLSSPKLLSRSAEELRQKHLIAKGLDEVKAVLDRGHKHFIILMGHCGNWELFSSGQLQLNDLGVQLEQLYRPLKNKAFDEVQKEMRTQHGASVLPKEQIGRRMIELVRNPESPATAFAFIADQTPSRGHVGLWANFLNRETAFLNGAERLARKFKLPVFYLDIKRLRDFEYEGRFILLSEHPEATEPNQLTAEYVKLLEQTIKNSPTDWLWSHKRWKFTKEEDQKKG